MCELLQSGEQSGERAQAANSLSALLSGGSRKRAEVKLFSFPAPHLHDILVLHLTCMIYLFMSVKEGKVKSVQGRP